VAKATAGALAASSTNKREIRTKSQSPILDYGWACGGRVGCGGDEGGGGRRRWRRALLSPQLLGGVYDERSIYRRRGR
jgi:hypothetical protein